MSIAPEASTAARWAVHLPTAGSTCVRLRLRPRAERDPWPFALAVTELTRLGAVATARFRSVGSGRGEPVLASQDMEWRGCALHLEVDAADLLLELPSWDEMGRTEASEAGFWDLVDGIAAAAGAAHGAIGDGEPLEVPGTRLPAGGGAAAPAALGRHLGLLVPWHDDTLPRWLADRYRELPRSGLAALLR